MRSGSDAPGTVAGAEARPTPLPKVNLTLLAVGPHAAARPSLPSPLPALLPPPMSDGERPPPSAAELDRLLLQVDANLERTLEVDALPVRPPWTRRRRRKSILAGLVLYLAVGSASFLWFAERAKREVPASRQTFSEPALAASAAASPESLLLDRGSAPVARSEAPHATVQGDEPAAHPARAAPPQAGKPERRVGHKKAKRTGKQLATRAKRKKRAARLAQPL